MNLALNPFTKKNLGGPKPEHGRMGLFLPSRKLLTPQYLPSRWERLKAKGWCSYWLPIPSDFPGMCQLGPQETEQFTASCPAYFALAGFHSFSNQPEGCTIDVYETNTQQSLTRTAGPSLLLSNLGGNAQHPLFLEEFFFMDPGDNLLATITNQSPNAVQGQVVAFGFGPVTSVVTPLPTGPPAGQPFFLNDAARRT